MNLPILSELKNDESTYITFSRAYVDMDEAIANGTEFYYSKIVALNIPKWERGGGPNSIFTDELKNILGVISESPNFIFPKILQYYMENILRQKIEFREITEIAFWKTLQYMGLQNPQNTVVFVNDVINSNFVRTENNNGWNSVICQIPNFCRKIKKVSTKVADGGLPLLVQSDDKDTALYDTGNKEFSFASQAERTFLDFPNFVFSSEEKSSFDFNTLLLFYRDKHGVDKLHGVNFIYPFENKVTFWEQPKLTQKTNQANSVGYQFIFNMKTCNNQASINQVQLQNENLMWWNGFEETMTSLNGFLENQLKQLNGKTPIPNIFTD